MRLAVSGVEYGSVFQTMESNEGERILDFFDEAKEPKTVGEVAEAFIGRIERTAVDATLQKLRSSGDLECKVLHPECIVYWRAKSVRTTGGEVLRTPRTSKGTTRRPPLRSFKTPARVDSLGPGPSPQVQSSRKARAGLTARMEAAQSDRNSRDCESLAKTITQLKRELEEVDTEIAELSQDHREEDLQLHIQALHEYNEIKDAGQILLGKLAEVERTTTASLYEKFGLSLDD